MKVIQIKTNPHAYSSNVFLVLCSWNRIHDINTLVDTGIDAYILQDISQQSTGIGKRAVEQIVCTHNHFDHTGGLSTIKNYYQAQILAYKSNPLADRPLHDGEMIRMGDAEFKVIHVPEHSNDSICLYSSDTGALFSGDTNLSIRTPEGNYSRHFYDFLSYISHLEVRTIYPGHGPVISDNIRSMLHQTLFNVDVSIHSRG